MRLTTEFRATSAGLFSRAKHWHLCCQVAFSHEERAIIEQRGLHHLYLQVPPAAPPPGTLSYVGVGLIRPASKLLLIAAGIMIVIGFVPKTGSLQEIGTWLLLFGIGLWLFSWWKERDADKRLSAADQQITLGQLLSDPDFSVYAYTHDQAEHDESQVREQLADLSARIRASAELRPQKTYDL